MCQKPGSWFFTIVEVLGLSTCLWTAGCWAEVGQIQHVPAGGRSSISFLTCHSALSESPPRTGEALVLGRHQHDNTYCLIAVWWMKSFNETGPNCAGKLPYFCVLNGSDRSWFKRTNWNKKLYVSSFWICDDIKELILLVFSCDNGVVLFLLNESLSFRDTSWNVSRWKDVISGIWLKIILENEAWVGI